MGPRPRHLTVPCEHLAAKYVWENAPESEEESLELSEEVSEEESEDSASAVG